MKAEVLFNYAIDKVRRFHLSPFNRLSHVATYTREMPVSLERMYENALDGEHLPYLHQSTFSYVDILESGSWGWRAKAGMQPRSVLTDMEIELVLYREEFCWKTRTLRGLGKGTEIWTHVIPLGERRIKVIVDFYVPKVPPLLKSIYADYYLEVYERLYDEDEMMMSQRQDALDLKADKPGRKKTQRYSLGTINEVKAKVPFTVVIEDQSVCVNALDGQLIAYSATCPHMLAPLGNEPVVNGVVECPWHAYRFDVKTGECVSGQRCRLKAAPTISIDDKNREVYLTPVTRRGE